jgi:Tol biopolymer transport system component
MISQTTTHRIGTGARKVRLLALALGAVLAAQVAMIPVTEREARAVSTEKIVFDSNLTTGTGVNNATGDSEIFKMNPDGTGLRQLTTNKVNDYRPALSPDGKKVTYVSKGIQTSNPQGEEDVYIMNVLDGTGKKNLSNTRAGVNDDFPVFSPGGKRIAYQSQGVQTSNLEGDYEVYRMSALDGTGQTNLTNNEDGVHDDYPFFSSDGTKIFYESEGVQDSNLQGGKEIYRLNASDGKGQKNLTNNDAVDIVYPD